MEFPPWAHDGFALLVREAQRPTTIGVIISLAVIAIMTRALSGSSKEEAMSSKTPSIPGYWVPFFGHAFEINANTTGFLASLRPSYPEGIFSLYLRGQIHSFIFRPSFATQLLDQPETVASGDWVRQAVNRTVFGLQGKLADAKVELEQLVQRDNLDGLTEAMVKQLKKHIADLVTFNTYPVDQADWEKLADADLIENDDKGKDPVMEVDLMELTRNFVANTAGAVTFGTDFVVNSPEFWPLLWVMDDNFRTLAAGLPSWLPWPKLQRGKLARRRMVGMAYEFQEALDKFIGGEDPGARWPDMENVSDVERQRVEKAREDGTTLTDRARGQVALAFSATVHTAPLVFWMLYEICSDPLLLAEIRQELAAVVRAVQPKSEFGLGVWLPPSLATFDVEGLETACPLLGSAYFETLRMYKGNWAVRVMKEDVQLGDADNKNNSNTRRQGFVLKKDTWAHVSEDMHHFDPEYFKDPDEWQGRRHIREEMDDRGHTKLVASMGTVQPVASSDASTRAGRDFTQRQVLAYVAAILAMYEIGPPDGKQWKRPKTQKHASVMYPTKDARVWVRRRKLAAEE